MNQAFVVYLQKINHKKKRLPWAKKHKQWILDRWKSVLWSDESKFEIFGSNRRVFVRHRVGERMISTCVFPTVKHGGGGVIVSGGLLVTLSVIYLEFKAHLTSILQPYTIQSGLRLVGLSFDFNRTITKHTSKLCKGYLTNKESDGVPHKMTWPPQSPDLNPFEMVWTAE